MSSTAAITAIPVLTGSNYNEWSSAMKAYLQIQRCWGIVSGTKPRPAVLNPSPAAGTTAPTAAQLEANTTAIENWDENDDAATGAIALRLSPQIRQISLLATAKLTWDHLLDQYGTPGAAGTFGIFKEAINFEMRENDNPTSSITTLTSLFERLFAAGLNLSEPIRCMILLAALPRAWDGLAMTIMSQYTGSDLKLVNIVPLIQDEFSRRQSNATSLSSRLSTVKKRKGKSSWDKQKKQKTSNEGSANLSSTPKDIKESRDNQAERKKKAKPKRKPTA